MSLKLVPKPDGYELREKRANKKENCELWLPEDALHSASKRMAAEPPVLAAVVAWYCRDEKGCLRVRYDVWQEHDRQSIALCSDLLDTMQG